jgi:hypothetical protein
MERRWSKVSVTGGRSLPVRCLRTLRTRKKKTARARKTML